jgi:HEAT repeat protein
MQRILCSIPRWRVLCLILVAFLAVGCRGRGQKSVSELMDLLKSSDPDKQRQAAADLGVLGPKAAKAVPTLTELLQDKDAGVRQQAAFALGRMGAEAAPAIKDLTRTLSDPEANVRKSAAEALGALGTEARNQSNASLGAEVRSAIDELKKKARSDPNPRVQVAAKDALSQIDPVQFPEP